MNEFGAVCQALHSVQDTISQRSQIQWEQKLEEIDQRKTTNQLLFHIHSVMKERHALAVREQNIRSGLWLITMIWLTGLAGCIAGRM